MLNLLWINNKPRNEKCWQQSFHLSIFQKLEDAGLDIGAEYQTGSGPIDFCISKGAKCRILIEIKLISTILNIIRELNSCPFFWC